MYFALFVLQLRRAGEEISYILICSKKCPIQLFRLE